MPTGPIIKRLWFENDSGSLPDIQGCRKVKRVLWNGLYIGRIFQSAEADAWGNEFELGNYPWQSPEEASFHLIGRYEVTNESRRVDMEWNVYLTDTGEFWMGPFTTADEAERAVRTTAGFDLPFETEIRQQPAGTAKRSLGTG